MNRSPMTTIGLTPEVEAFVTAVRGRFADLGSEERDDLLDGLEADMADLVAERGPEALGDPQAYAAELRAAAGLPDLVLSRGPRFHAIGLGEVLDDLHRFWERSLDALPGSPRGLIESLAPVWWVLRAVAAWMLLQDLRGPSVVLSGAWFTVLAAMILVSVQLGRRGWGLGVLRTSSAGRLLVVALNLFALSLLPGAGDRMVWRIAEERGPALYGNEWYDQVNPDVLTYQDQQICTLRVVDKEGKRVEDLRVLDVTSDRLLPMNNPGC